MGVEIPNPTARIVTLRELFETPEWERRAVLPIALGHDLEGKPVIADLTKMPHLLIAGPPAPANRSPSIPSSPA